MPEKYRPEGSTVDYVIPSLDDPADGPVAFRDFADSIPPALSPVVPIHAKTADYTLVADDEGALVTFDCTAKDLNVTVPADKTHNLPVGSVIVVGCLGTNRKSSLTILAEEGVTLRDLAVRKVAWSRMAALIKVAADSWIINAGTGGSTPTTIPSPPVLLTAAGGVMQVGLTWKAPTDDGGSSLTAYLIERSKDQKVWDTAASTGPQTLATSAPVPDGGVTWYFRARAANANGVSDPSNILSADVKPPYNEATGGTETVVDNYNGTGEKWKIHVFDSAGTFKVTNSTGLPFKVLVVAGGGGGAGRAGNNAQGAGGGNGGAGGVRQWDNAQFAAGSFPVAVGVAGGGGDGGGQPCQGGDGGPSSVSTYSTTGGGGGGIGAPGRNGGSGGGGGCAIGNWGGPWGGGSGISGEGTNGQSGSGSNDGSNAAGGSMSFQTDIRGTKETYSPGVAGGGGGGGNWAEAGRSGQQGRVVIAYRVG